MPCDAKTVQVIVFIYRAVEDGWVVKKLAADKYEFRKPLENITQEVTADDFPTSFLRNFTSIDNFFAYLRGT